MGAPVKKCVCKAPYIGDGFSCRLGKNCPKACPAPSICTDGKCKCENHYTWYNWSLRKCVDRNECANPKGNNCHAKATCTNKINAGYICQCNAGLVGDGVTCLEKEGGETYSDNGNPYIGGGQVAEKPALVLASAFAVPTEPTLIFSPTSVTALAL